jgi:hypothetical protein
MLMRSFDRGIPLEPWGIAIGAVLSYGITAWLKITCIGGARPPLLYRRPK